MNDTHSPGPWVVNGCINRGRFIIDDAKGRPVAVTEPRSGFEVNRNADLIAAAPSMLEALEMLVQPGPTSAYAIAIAQGVIDKAKGR